MGEDTVSPCQEAIPEVGVEEQGVALAHDGDGAALGKGGYGQGDLGGSATEVQDRRRPPRRLVERVAQVINGHPAKEAFVQAPHDLHGVVVVVEEGVATEEGARFLQQRISLRGLEQAQPGRCLEVDGRPPSLGDRDNAHSVIKERDEGVRATHGIILEGAEAGRELAEELVLEDQIAVGEPSEAIHVDSGPRAPGINHDTKHIGVGRRRARGVAPGPSSEGANANEENVEGQSAQEQRTHATSWRALHANDGFNDAQG